MIRGRRTRHDATTDYIGMACTSAGVSLREPLTPDELVKALLTGKAPKERRAHFVVLLEEAPEELLRGWRSRWDAGRHPPRSRRT